MSEHHPPAGWSVARRQWRGARSYQEDDLRVVERASGEDRARPRVLLVLADGMGGEVGGAQASRVVVESFAHRFGEFQGTTDERLNGCLDAASGALAAQVREDPALDGMGSTVVAALYDGEGVSWLSVGDSPMWLFTGGRMTRLNEDHSMAPVLDRMAEDGELSPEEALHDRRRHMLRSAVTGYPVEHVNCDHHAFRLGRNDFLVLASDGLETLPVDYIERVLRATRGDPEAAAEALMSAVKDADQPHQDNVTLLVLSGEGEAGEERVRPGSAFADRSAGSLMQRLGMARVAVAGSLLAGLVTAVGLISWQLHEPSDPPPPVPLSSDDSGGESRPGGQPAREQAPAKDVPQDTEANDATPAESTESPPSTEEQSPAEEAPPSKETTPTGETPPTKETTPPPAKETPSTGERSPGEDSESTGAASPGEDSESTGAASSGENSGSTGAASPGEDSESTGAASSGENSESTGAASSGENSGSTGAASPGEDSESTGAASSGENSESAGEASSDAECPPTGEQPPAEACPPAKEHPPADQAPPPEGQGGSEPRATARPAADEPRAT